MRTMGRSALLALFKTFAPQYPGLAAGFILFGLACLAVMVAVAAIQGAIRFCRRQRALAEEHTREALLRRFEHPQV